MGVAGNILLFMIILNVVFIVLGVETPATSLLSSFLDINTTTGTAQVSSSFITKLIAVTLTAGIFATAFGLIPNVSLGVLTMFLISFATFPISVFNSAGVPFELKMLIGAILGIMYLIALISFVRGSEL